MVFFYSLVAAPLQNRWLEKYVPFLPRLQSIKRAGKQINICIIMLACSNFAVSFCQHNAASIIFPDVYVAVIATPFAEPQIRFRVPHFRFLFHYYCGVYVVVDNLQLSVLCVPKHQLMFGFNENYYSK